MRRAAASASIVIIEIGLGAEFDMAATYECLLDVRMHSKHQRDVQERALLSRPKEASAELMSTKQTRIIGAANTLFRPGKQDGNGDSWADAHAP
jgi:hypothetical protein